MPLNNYTSQQIIYKEADVANEISLLIKGTVEIRIGNNIVSLRAGDIIGITDVPGTPRRFSCIAADDVTIYSYPYNSFDDIVTIINENEKLSSTITSRLIKLAGSLSSLCKGLHKKANTEYNQLMLDYKNYPEICAQNGKKPNDHSEMESVENPDYSTHFPEWKTGFFKSLSDYDSIILNLLTASVEACCGFAVNALEYIEELSEDIKNIRTNFDLFNKKTSRFKMEIDMLKSGAAAIASGEKDRTMPNMHNSLNQILIYSEVDDAISSAFSQAVESYINVPDRTDTSDTLRTIRRSIAANYYTIYENVFKKFLEDPEQPPIMKMFLMFGFVDERIVEQEDLEKLYSFSLSHVPDKNGRILTVYEWLQKVYSMEVEPSLNEFQLEYVAYLREAKQNGDISEDLMKQMLNDPDARLNYEIKNLVTLGNRMTYGRVSTFCPLFDSQVRMLPLERSFLSHEVLTGELDRIRSVDFSCFYREKMFVIEDSKALNDKLQLFVHEEQPPFMILFPIVGNHLVLWQNIEGRKRNTPARMLLPIFFEENLSDHFTSLCGEYRWEVCKTDQGVHWNDITDPSLTAEYNDFLQFFKKNSQLSAEHKDKIKTAIKKQQNNYKKVFMVDYSMYVKFESAGNMRLLKQQREMLYKYCPFGPEVRAHLASSPQYEKLIEIRANKQEQKVRPLHNIVLKMEHAEEAPPQELLDEIAYLEI